MHPWADQIDEGWQLRYSAQIYGIPILLTSPGQQRATLPAATLIAPDPPAPPDGLDLVEAWMLSAADRIGIGLDRGPSGVAAGDVLTLTLDMGTLEALGLTSIFRAPLVAEWIASDIDGAEDPYDATGDPSRTIYVGRERMQWTGSAWVRGVAGLPEAHARGARLTERPAVWVGRFIEIHEHLATPAGHVLADTWTEGDYAHVVWRGYITEAPRVTEHGIQIRCAPLVRLPASDLVTPIEGVTVPLGRTTRQGQNAPLVLFGPQDQVTFTIRHGSGTDTYTWPRDMPVVALTLGEWCATIEVQAIADTAGRPWRSSSDPVRIGRLIGRLRVGIAGTTGGDAITGVTVTPHAPFIVPGDVELDHVQASWRGHLDLAAQDTGWLAIRIEHDDLGYPPVPTSGHALVGETEVIRYDAAEQVTDEDYAIRVVARDVTGSGRVDAFDREHPIALGVGTVGPLATVILELLQSSGTGLRGAHDTLGRGQGYGIPEDWIDLASIDRYPLAGHWISAIDDAQSSLGELVGGALSLLGLCLVQRYGRLAVVDTIPASGPDLTREWVLIGSHQPGEVRRGPSVVEVEVGPERVVRVTDRDLAAQGATEEWSHRAHGMDRLTAALLAGDILRLSDGTGLLTVRVPLAAEPQPGDAVTLASEHPAVYSWPLGERAPAAIRCRVASWSRDLAGGSAIVRLLTEGPLSGAQHLAPGATVESKSGATITLAAGEVALLEIAVGERVNLYNPGSESTEQADTSVTAISGDTLTLGATPAAWVAAGTRVTWPEWDDASTRQRRDMYQRTGSRWV